LGEDGGEGNLTLVSEQSAEGVAVRSTISHILIFITSQSAAAPEKIRTKVKVAGSMVFSFNAARHKSELLAKAIIASSVSMKIRVVLRNLPISNLTAMH
jgi:hypothetical protein